MRLRALRWMMLGATFVITNVFFSVIAAMHAPAVAQTQTQQLIAPAKFQFSDNNGVPALVLPVRLNSRPERTRLSELDSPDHGLGLLTKDSAFRELFFRLNEGVPAPGGRAPLGPLFLLGGGG
jgi:hypothetical protein